MNAWNIIGGVLLLVGSVKGWRSLDALIIPPLRWSAICATLVWFACGMIGALMLLLPLLDDGVQFMEAPL